MQVTVVKTQNIFPFFISFISSFSLSRAKELIDTHAHHFTQSESENVCQPLSCTLNFSPPLILCENFANLDKVMSYYSVLHTLNGVGESSLFQLQTLVVNHLFTQWFSHYIALGTCEIIKLSDDFFLCETGFGFIKSSQF